MGVTLGFTSIPFAGFDNNYFGNCITDPFSSNLVAVTVPGAPSYNWTIADAWRVPDPEPQTISGQSVTVQCHYPGGKNVTLSVTIGGITTTFSKGNCLQVSDWGNVLVDYDAWPVVPPPDQMDPLAGTAPFTVLFTGVQNLWPQYPVYFHWDFGDGTTLDTVDTPNCTHTYLHAGNYGPRLTCQTTLLPTRGYCLGTGTPLFFQTNAYPGYVKNAALIRLT